MTTARHIFITKLEQSGYKIEDVYQLVNEAWRQWDDVGLHSEKVSAEQFVFTLSHRAVFVAIDEQTGELIGCHVLKTNRRKRMVTGSFLAVSPMARGQGIATRLFEEECVRLARKGYSCVQESTAIAAIWSVNWHLKNGFRIIGYTHKPGCNYASYIFRYQLVPSLLWSVPLAPLTCRARYVTSYLFNYLFRDGQGNLNVLGRFIKSRLRHSAILLCSHLVLG